MELECITPFDCDLCKYHFEYEDGIHCICGRVMCPNCKNIIEEKEVETHLVY